MYHTTITRRRIMPRKNGYAFSEDEEAALALAGKITHVVTCLMSSAGYSQARFAKEIGFSRTTFNQVLKSTGGNHIWRLPMLCAVARVLHVSVASILQAAESDKPEVLRELAHKSLLWATKPGSPERLRRLIIQALTIFIEVLDPEDYENKYKCTPLEIEQGAPEFYAAFSSGVLSDTEVMVILKRANAYVSEKGGLGNFPFWAAVKAVYPV